MTTTGYLRFPHIVGDQIVFTAEDDLWLVSAAGGQANRLTADRVPVSRPRLSPDGASVAWVSRRGGEAEVFAMPTSGGTARQLTYFGHPGTTLVGYDPAGRLIVYSAGSQPFRSHVWAYAIDLTDGADPTPQRLQYGPVVAVSHGPSGATVVGTGYLRDYAHWKRYRGGTAGRLWIDPTGAGEFTELAGELVGPKTHPTWLADRLAFLADFEGHGNVYSVAADGSQLRRHTDHSQFYARQLAGDGQRLVYQHAGQVWLIDDLAADAQPRRLDISLTSPRSNRAEAPVPVAEHLGELAVDLAGRASAIEIRGSIVWLTHRNGPARVLASTPGVRYRTPVILAGADGDSVAYLTSADGADAIEISGPAGERHRFGAGELGRVLELAAAPDGSRLVAASHDGRLLSIGLDQTITELDRSPYGDISGLAFSPDSRWLAYAAEESTGELNSIRLLELSTGAITAITEQRFNDTAPAFSLDGKYLGFLSARTFDPVYDAHVFDLAFPLATRPYLVTLAASTPSPFDPELAGTASDNADSKPAQATAGESADRDADAAGVAPIQVDLAGIADRIVAFPVAAGRIRNLFAVKDGFSWANAPVTGELGESRNPDDDVRPSLHRWDFGKRKLIELAEHLDEAHASADGRSLVVRDGKELRVVPADRKPAEDGSDTVKVDLSRVRLNVQPPAEWAQMLDETG
ncbi:MAG: peptidase S41, partial [Jatrophihabitantaceae bacterium]